MKRLEPSEKHKQIRDALLDLMRKEMAETPADEILAIVSYTVGQLVAMQDATKCTLDVAMEIVATNIEAGNQDAIKEAAKPGFWRPN